MAPVIRALRSQPWADVRVLATAQHREMMDSALSVLAISPDIDLDIMTPNQTLSVLTARLLPAVDDILRKETPDVALVQGDTTTVLAAALACFYQNIPIGHVEAGLRTQDLANPFPEEMNRVVTSRLARFHFAPTETARANLLREGVARDRVFVTGNTVIDALLEIARENIPIGVSLDGAKRLILATGHRRENFGRPMAGVCRALRRIVEANPDVELLYPVHPNPNVSDVVHRELGAVPRVHLCAPLGYGAFVSAMKRAHFIITDSGGVQEEAPALGKPVLVTRSETERPEAVQAGVVQIVGTDEEVIIEHAQRLLTDRGAYQSMAKGISPYGDGKASERIVRALFDWSHREAQGVVAKDS